MMDLDSIIQKMSCLKVIKREWIFQPYYWKVILTTGVTSLQVSSVHWDMPIKPGTQDQEHRRTTSFDDSTGSHSTPSKRIQRQIIWLYDFRFELPSGKLT